MGHSLQHDLNALNLQHPYSMRRDTALNWSLRRYANNGRTPSLKVLCEYILDYTIQNGEHNSVEDARAAMDIYKSLRDDWENYILKKKRANKSKRQSLKKAPHGIIRINCI